MLKNNAFQILMTFFSLWWIKVDGFRDEYYVLTQRVLNLFLNLFTKSYK